MTTLHPFRYSLCAAYIMTRSVVSVGNQSKTPFFSNNVVRLKVSMPTIHIADLPPGHTFCTACLDGALNVQYSQLQEENAEVQLSCPHCRAWIVHENDIHYLDIDDTGREVNAQLWLYQYP